jgi:hypothetical protein
MGEAFSPAKSVKRYSRALIILLMYTYSNVWKECNELRGTVIYENSSL